MGNLVRRKETYRYSAQKVMEFSQQMADILVYESCMLELYIFEIDQVIGENLPIAFLYVLSIYAHEICLLPIGESDIPES